MRILVAILRLCRIEYVGFGYVALLGAFAERGIDLAPSRIVGLLIANMLFVAWTFAHNDLCDVEIDRRASALDERVLVRGDLSIRAAQWLIVVLVATMLLVAWFQLGLEAAIAFAGASALAVCYDLVSKRLLGSDFLFAASAAGLAVAGACAAVGSFSLSPLASVVIAIVFVEHLFFNAIEGGLKDVVSDRAAGAVTFAQRWVRVDGEAIAIAPAFRWTGLGLKAASVVLAAVPLIPRGGEAVPQLIALGAVGAVALGFSARLLSRRRYDWIAIAKDLMPIEMASRLFVPILLFDRIGAVPLASLFLVPAIWYLGFAKLVHARGLALPKRF